MPRVRPEDVIAAPGNALLIVDHPDRRAGGVPVIADRMTVDRRRQAFGFRGPERTRQRLISGCARLQSAVNPQIRGDCTHGRCF